MVNHSSYFDFAEACEYLGLAPDTLAALRSEGLIACANKGERQVYPQPALDLTRYLLELGKVRGWNTKCLAWYADLLFAAEIGHAIFLPMNKAKRTGLIQPINWLETPYITAVLNESKEATPDKTDAAVLTPLRSLLAVTVGDEQFWPSVDDLEQSTLYPLVKYFEDRDIGVLDQGKAIARDAAYNFITIMFAFINIAPPISDELERLVTTSQRNIKGISESTIEVSPEEQEAILKQPLIAVEKVYASKANEIHTPANWEIQPGLMLSQKQTVSLEMKIPPVVEQDFIDNLIDLIRPFVGIYGARVIHLLYEVANNPPHWRTPLITVQTNELLDRMGVSRTAKGYHHSKNREQLRDALNAAHNLEIVGEYTAWEDGKQLRKAFRRTVLSIIGASFDAEETQNLSTSELFQRGLPKTLQIRLNFYDGVRRPDGRLGNNFVLMPVLPAPQKLAKANYSATDELLKTYFLFRYRQLRMSDRTLSVARHTALEKANITNKHLGRATATLRKALDKLVKANILESYSDIPHHPQETFHVTLSEAFAQKKETDG